MDDPKRRIRAEYDELSPEYDQRWRSYVERSVSETRRRADILRTDRVLDVGCGTGALLASLPATFAVGIDLSIGMLLQARSAVAKLACGDAERLPFSDACFDAVLSSSSLHFWPSAHRALEEIRRVLRPGGRVVITDWCANFLACRVVDTVLRMRDPAYRRSLTRAECAEVLIRSGFENVSVETYRISILWGLMTATATAGAAAIAELQESL